jgi:hypothetical protein
MSIGAKSGGAPCELNDKTEYGGAVEIKKVCVDGVLLSVSCDPE